MAFYENKVEHYGGALVLFTRNLSVAVPNAKKHRKPTWYMCCLLYTSDAADE